MGRGSRSGWLFVATACWVGMLAGALQAQERRGFENLQFFPKDIPRSELIQHMREFSFALDVRCEYCHVSDDELPRDQISFASDAKITKRRARYMLEMVRTINTSLLAGLPERDASGPTVECETCHRGSAVPKLLGTELTEVIESDGVEAAVTRYRELRKNAILGKYSFSEWTINELARTLREDGKPDAAIAMLKMNAEYYPDSAAIDLALADLYQSGGDRDQAIARYRMALEKQPDNRRARERLEALEQDRD